MNLNKLIRCVGLCKTRWWLGGVDGTAIRSDLGYDPLEHLHFEIFGKPGTQGGNYVALGRQFGLTDSESHRLFRATERDTKYHCWLRDALTRRKLLKACGLLKGQTPLKTWWVEHRYLAWQILKKKLRGEKIHWL